VLKNVKTKKGASHGYEQEKETIKSQDFVHKRDWDWTEDAFKESEKKAFQVSCLKHPYEKVWNIRHEQKK
jgi:hypothetical protein